MTATRPHAFTDVRAALRDNKLRYSYNVDVTSYKDEARVNFNYNAQDEPGADDQGACGAGWLAGWMPGCSPLHRPHTRSAPPHPPPLPQLARVGEPEVADPEVVWARHAAGCSVRLLHPQRYSDALWRLGRGWRTACSAASAATPTSRQAARRCCGRDAPPARAHVRGRGAASSKDRRTPLQPPSAHPLARLQLPPTPPRPAVLSSAPSSPAGLRPPLG
jgi:hypothetical protein